MHENSEKGYKTFLEIVMQVMGVAQSVLSNLTYILSKNRRIASFGSLALTVTSVNGVSYPLIVIFVCSYFAESLDVVRLLSPY